MIENDRYWSFSSEEFIKKYNLDPAHINFLKNFLTPMKFHLTYVPVIAGGFLRRWFNGEKLENMTCDIDLYLIKDSEVDLDNTPSTFPIYTISAKKDTNLTQEALFENINSFYGVVPEKCELGYGHYIANIAIEGKPWKVQIMAPSFEIAESTVYGIKYLLKTYDSTISMIAYHYETDSIIVHEKFAEMNMDKLIDFNTSARINSPDTQLYRFQKFIKEGYSLTSQAISDYNLWTYKTFYENGGSSPRDSYGQ